MKNFYLFLAVLLVASCGDSTAPPSSTESSETATAYTVMEQDLKILKDDFNANQGTVRLLFLSGPTCGICLRGMADLNDAFLAEHQNDDRLVTFIVHVPTMGAKEKHVADTIPLLHGPRIHHYWEDSGIIGQHYSEVMEVDNYVWDFWAIYGPAARWEGLLPPTPDYYEHQLGVSSGSYRSFPRERVLDADRFAAKTLEFVAAIEGGSTDSAPADDASASNLFADGTDIPVVGQPRNLAVRQHIILRGGYKNLKRIQSVVSNGHLESTGQTYDLKIVAARPNDVRRELTQGENRSIAKKDSGEVFIESGVGRGIPAVVEEQLLRSFEFDGLFVEWPDKGHELSMDGMRKFNDILAWRLVLKQKNGPVWNLFLDSHTGDLIQKEALDAVGEPALIIRQSDFREVDGFRFPFRIEYADGNRESIAVEVFDSITVEGEAFVVEDEAITH